MTGNVEKTGNMYRKPNRIFEDSGIVYPQEAYHVQLDNVWNTRKQDIKTMVDKGRYFSIFAPRQSGKTTFLKDICEELHRDSMYMVISLSFQKYKDLEKEQFYSLIEKDLYQQLMDRLKEVNCDKTDTVNRLLEGHRLRDHISFSLLFEELNRVIEFKKIMIFIDEFDGIPLSELENFLVVLRDLYQKYKGVTQKALYSVGLVGIRNITKLVVGGVSPFNIADEVVMPPFSLENVRDLFAQYTDETNQPFTGEAIDRIYRETSGQPWLINRLGTILTVDIKPETMEPIDESDVEQAIQVLLTERNSHFDNLYEKAKKFKETFVKIVFNNVKYSPDDEDQAWLEQYGLTRKREKKAVVANNIYRERYIDTFFSEAGGLEGVSAAEYILPGGRLDMERVLLHFQQYISQIGVKAFYKDKKPYERTGQFLLTAWLYQFVKAGSGELRYEVLSGLGRLDILLIHNGRRYILETKVNRQALSRTVNDGIAQVSKKYLSSEAVDEGYLVIFDTRTPVGEEIEPQYHQLEGKTVVTFIIGIALNE